MQRFLTINYKNIEIVHIQNIRKEKIFVKIRYFYLKKNYNQTLLIKKINKTHRFPQNSFPYHLHDNPKKKTSKSQTET